MDNIYLTGDAELVSWVIEHLEEIQEYEAYDDTATFFTMTDGTIVCVYT